MAAAAREIYDGAMTSTSKLSAFALAILAGCTPVTSTSSGAPTGAPTSTRTGAPTDPWATTTSATPPTADAVQLTGTWVDHWSASMQYGLATQAYDFERGVWFGGLPSLWDMAPNRGLGIAFTPDGTFLWVRASDGGVGGCKSSAVHVMKGTATVEAGVIHLHPTAQRQRYDSTCDPSLRYDRELANADLALGYALGATVDTGRPTLRLVDAATGEAHDYVRN